MFELFETIANLAYVTLTTTPQALAEAVNVKNGDRNFVWSPVGRTAWHREMKKEILSELRDQNLSDSLLRAGFARNDIAYYGQAIDSIERMMARVEWDF